MINFYFFKLSSEIFLQNVLIINDECNHFQGINFIATEQILEFTSIALDLLEVKDHTLMSNVFSADSTVPGTQ